MKLAIFYTAPSYSLLGYLDAEQKLLGCHEAQSYLIMIPDRNARLYADDALLEKDDVGEHWIWQPGFFAGELTFECELPERATPLRYIVDVGPAKHKTGRNQFLEYLQQIIDYAPRLLIGTEPGKHGLGGRSSYVALWLRYARLRQFLDRYLLGLQAINERPIIRLNSRREQMPLHMAKRVDGFTVQRLVNSPGLLSALAGESTHENTVLLDTCNLDVPFHEPALDNPANRLMARQLGEVRRLTRRLLAEIINLQVRVSETETDLMARLPRRIRFLRSVDKQLGRISRQDPFVSTHADKQGVAEFNAVSGNPHYSMTHQTGIQILRQGFSEMASDQLHYIAPTWEIYEAWCFVTIAEELEARFPDYSWQLDKHSVSADLVLRGQADEKSLSLFFQMTCRPLEKPNRYGYFSISRERRPDLLLEIVDGNHKQFACLDSKYTASRAGILDSMSSAHIYRDSLRCGPVSPALSIILVPANESVSVLSSDEYWKRHKVGCAMLSQPSEVPAILDRIFQSFEEGFRTVNNQDQWLGQGTA